MQPGPRIRPVLRGRRKQFWFPAARLSGVATGIRLLIRMKRQHYLIALDQGTTSCRAVVFSDSGETIASAQQSFGQYYPQPGWVEHDAEEIWRTQLAVLNQAVDESRIEPDQFAAIGLTNQRETAVLWDRKSGRPVAPAIVWQCRRTANLCENLVRNGHSEMIRRKTGLVPDAYFSADRKSVV